jgi:hypothetical protein
LNKKSQQVIERLEAELAQSRQELERANKIIHQQHEMYYNIMVSKNSDKSNSSFNNDYEMVGTEAFSESKRKSFKQPRYSTSSSLAVQKINLSRK